MPSKIRRVMTTLCTRFLPPRKQVTTAPFHGPYHDLRASFWMAALCRGHRPRWRGDREVRLCRPVRGAATIFSSALSGRNLAPCGNRRATCGEAATDVNCANRGLGQAPAWQRAARSAPPTRQSALSPMAWREQQKLFSLACLPSHFFDLSLATPTPHPPFPP